MNQPSPAPLRVLFLIQDLNHGGAQRQLSILARGLHTRGHTVSVAVFYPGGALTEELQAAGITLYDLDKRGRWDLPGFLLRLHRCLRHSGAQCLHSYLTVSNLLSVLLGAWRPGLRVVWGVRSSAIQPHHRDPLASLCGWLESRLAPLANLVISNSQAGRQHAITRGFPANRLRVVANGIDTRRFQVNLRSGVRQRQLWRVAPEARLIGLVGRLDPLKNHRAFLQMAAQLLANHPTLRFVCVGDGPARYHRSLHIEALALGLGEALIWAGDCEDMPAVYNALDLLVSSSLAEGFANVIGEAMACEVPCVVTAVGDSTIIVADTGVVIPSADPSALAGACEQLLALPHHQRRDLGQRARQRVLNQFSVARLITGTEQLLDCLATHRPLPAPLEQPSATDS